MIIYLFIKKIILASNSKQRKSLFSVLNIPFEVIPADIDEKAIRDDNLKKRAEKIARAKAEKIKSKYSGIVIAADTFVVLGDKILEKPESLNEARKMLELQSGQEVIVYTGFCYLDTLNHINFSKTSSTIMNIRELSKKEINIYIKKFPVTTWSGAFSPAYPYGTTLINKIRGSFTGMTHGLPLELLIPLLKKSGFDVSP